MLRVNLEYKKNEGIENVNKTRLKRLITNFENLTMLDLESITNFYVKICDILDKSYALAEEYSNAKLVCKVLVLYLKSFFQKSP